MFKNSSFPVSINPEVLNVCFSRSLVEYKNLKCSISLKSNLQQRFLMLGGTESAQPLEPQPATAAWWRFGVLLVDLLRFLLKRLFWYLTWCSCCPFRSLAGNLGVLAEDGSRLICRKFKPLCSSRVPYLHVSALMQRQRGENENEMCLLFACRPIERGGFVVIII